MLSQKRVTLASLSKVCSAHYTSVESSISRAPLSQTPAIDERKSSFDAVVEGNSSDRSSTTNLRQGSLPSSSSGFDIAVEPPVFSISYLLPAHKNILIV